MEFTALFEHKFYLMIKKTRTWINKSRICDKYDFRTAIKNTFKTFKENKTNSMSQYYVEHY